MRTRRLVAILPILIAIQLAVPQPALPAGPIRAFAYFYIWYDATSWGRAKTTYPLAGRYASDDVAVMRRQIAQASSAGLGGFIVSWKSTPKLDRRLAALVRAADAARFKLAIIYQGLDFYRRPLPAARVAADIASFAQRFRSNPAFDLEEKPVVIWSGTWKYTRSQVAYVSSRVRSRVLLLASEKSVAGYERVADLVDGDAYYWSSVNPGTQPGYVDKLVQMSEAVHSRGGLWIAPAAPGFDARLVGGTRVVARDNGQTLRREWSAALASSPDLIGLISWNEYSENSEVEPTLAFGTRYLDVVRDITGTPVAIQGNFDSSSTPPRQFGNAVPFLIGIALLMGAGVGAVLWRREVKKALGRSA